jgi:hypothetical protein
MDAIAPGDEPGGRGRHLGLVVSGIVGDVDLVGSIVKEELATRKLRKAEDPIEAEVAEENIFMKAALLAIPGATVGALRGFLGLSNRHPRITLAPPGLESGGT